ncbi:MAG TPA: archease [bacterium]|nr:archease [bacterium]HNS48450.1 archease [bacterium]
MKPEFREFEHTADRGLELAATSLAGLFRAALAGLFFLYTGRPLPESPGEATPFRIRLAAGNAEELLVKTLNEAIFRTERAGHPFRPVELRLRKRPAGGLSLTLGLTNVIIFPIIAEIKSATHHQLKIEKERGVWRCRVIFDV